MQKELNLKQQRFVIEYLKDQNATRAATRAGYSRHTAYSIGSELLRKPEIKEAILSKMSKVQNTMIADRAEREQFWTDTMRKTNVEYQHRIKTSELLGKVQGDFIEKVEHSVSEDFRELIVAAAKARQNVAV